MFKTVSNWFNRNDEQAKEARTLEKEAQAFSLPDERTLMILKVIFLAGLALLNFRLFHKSIPGLWGVGVGLTAVVSEIMIYYSTHYFSRSAGGFRWCLGIFGGALLAFSIIHGAFSVYDLMSAGIVTPEFTSYSKHYAFPILAGLIGVGSIVTAMFHPVCVIRLKQAFEHTKIAQSRAEAASELQMMRTQAIVDNQKLANIAEQNEREEKYLVEVKKLINTRGHLLDVLNSIPDPEMKAQLAREMKVSLSPGANWDADQTSSRRD